jgi:hypothetical protein
MELLLLSQKLAKVQSSPWCWIPKAHLDKIIFLTVTEGKLIEKIIKNKIKKQRNQMLKSIKPAQTHPL